MALGTSVLKAGDVEQTQGGSSIDPTTLKALVDHGLSLEFKHRWQDAIQHYERSLRKFPKLADVEHRLQIARIHHDIVRRYSDSTFLSSIDETDASRVLDLFSEVLSKLELNYVEPIDLTAVVRHGTAFLECALTEKDFLQRHLQGSQPVAVEQFRANVHKVALASPIRNRNEARAIVWKVANLANQQLGLKPTAAMYEYVCGAVGLLDSYSGYMTSGELNEVMAQIKGNLIGLGVELSAERDVLRIVEVFPRSPAAMAGLIAGDKILQVGRAVTSEVTAKRAADLLRGPENSQVSLLIERRDADSDAPMEPKPFTVTRRRVDVPSVPAAEMLDSPLGIAYIRLTNFQETTPHEVDLALRDLHRQGMRSLIIDLRRNPGGLLDAAVELADRFLKRGPIVSTQGRNAAENRTYAAHEPQTWEIPLTVLIDADSASASEIFAGAIRDHRRGMLVGQTSYGKGSVQGLFHTDVTSGGLRLTVSKFFSPNGTPISRLGVRPHVAVDPQGLEGPDTKSSANRYVGSSISRMSDQDGLARMAAKFEIPASDADVYAKAKPVLGADGGSTINFRSKDQDLVLRRAIEVARDAVRLTAQASP
jgi:carboxyl-terminal processing protease